MWITTKKELFISSCDGSRRIRLQGGAVVGNTVVTAVVKGVGDVSGGAVVVSGGRVVVSGGFVVVSGGPGTVVAIVVAAANKKRREFYIIGMYNKYVVEGL